MPDSDARTPSAGPDAADAPPEPSSARRARLVKRTQGEGSVPRLHDVRLPGSLANGATGLAVVAKSGDAEAREQLIDRFLPLVRSIARSYRAEGLEFVDLVQEGIVGLLRALERYEPELGTPFEPYALLWIRQSLQELRSDFMRPLRLPPRALRQLAELKSEHNRFYAAEHREPTLDELSERTGLGRPQVDSLVRADARARLLSDPLEVMDGEVGVLGDMIEDPLSPDMYEEVLDSIVGEQIRDLLGRLSGREREIVDARFGFGDREPERLQAIGGRLGLSAERVRQLEERALAKLRLAADDASSSTPSS